LQLFAPWLSFGSLGIMRESFTKWILSEPRLESAGIRYGFLAAYLALLVFFAIFPPWHHYGAFIIALILVFRHLAFEFRWSRSLMVALRLVACLLLVFGSIFIFYQLFTSL
jgi:hypothetical protein